jgi:uncharacterized membrane protein
MKSARFGKLWDSLNSSFWFVPSLMVALAIALSFFTIGIDQKLESDIIGDVRWAYSLGPSGSRAVLSAIAGSMVSVATTAFSITIVALQLASSQFGPRLLRNFMQDGGNQVVLGTFISTFVYSLMVLRTVNEVEGSEFVPQVAVTVAIALAIASIGVLIYFLHHAASSIQVDNVINEVGKDLDEAIERLFPKTRQQGSTTQNPEVDLPADSQAHPVKAKASGYIQAIDEGQLRRIATEHDLLLRVQQKPGRFVVQGSELVQVYDLEQLDPIPDSPDPKDPGSPDPETQAPEIQAPETQALDSQIEQAFVMGSKPTNQQDLEFSINQLVEIAVRALSPGINDPFTAIRCIDQLSATLCQLAQRESPSPYRYDDQKQLRVVVKSLTFADITDTAFNQIRQNGQSSVAVTVRLLEAIAIIASFTHRDSDRTALRRQAEMLDRGSQTAIAEALDRQDIQSQYLRVMSAIAPDPPPLP